MRYQNPQLLYALFAIAIPILIHLFNFRKHKIIYFSSIRFLTEIKEKNKKKSQLRNLLILISRILAITFLILAFAKPYIPVSNQQESKNIFIYLDNSLSMDVDFGKGNLLNLAKEKAQEIVNAYPEESNFYLITNEFDQKHNSSYSANAILAQIEDVESSARNRSILNILERKVISANNHCYIISDFQKSTVNLKELVKIDSTEEIYFLPVLNSDVTNISIDSCYINSPVFVTSNTVELNVIISNTSNNEIIDEVIFLNINTKQKAQQYISLLANETKEISFNFTTDTSKYISGEILTNDVPVSYDNSLFFTLKVAEGVNVFVINQDTENSAFNSLFKNDSLVFKYTSVNLQNINYKKLSQQDFIIINELSYISSGLTNSLNKFVKNGGNIVVIPPKDLNDFEAYNSSLNSLGLNRISKVSDLATDMEIKYFNLEDRVYLNVFKDELKQLNYPTTKEYYKYNNIRENTTVISLANKQSLLSSFSKEKGLIYQFYIPLNTDKNNFTQHALFVPTLFNMAISSVQIDAPYYIINKAKGFNSSYHNLNKVTYLKGNGIDIIPPVKIKNGKPFYLTHNHINQNGIYQLISDSRLVDKIAFNYSKKESNTITYNTSELENHLTENNIQNIKVISTTNNNLRNTIKEQQTGKEFWKLALLLSLVFFAIEILLIKLIKL